MTEMPEGEPAPKLMPPIHPGEILNEEFLIPMNVTPRRLAKSIGVDAHLIQAIINAQEPVSAETALLLARFFGTSAELWAGLQLQYDLEMAEDRLGEKLAAVVAYAPE